METELEDVTAFRLLEDDHPNCAHITLVRLQERWIIGFDFQYNKELSAKHVQAARDFYEVAKFALERGSLRPFVDNLFSAAELAVKALLLSIPDPSIRNSKKHEMLTSRFNRFASLGNIDPEPRDAFNRLFKLRLTARYLEGDLSMDKEDGRKLLSLVASMIEDAASPREITQVRLLESVEKGEIIRMRKVRV